MANIAKLLKGDIHEEFKERAQRALNESAKAAKEGRRKLDDLRARLEFRSVDSEAGSYRGGHSVRSEEAAPRGRPLTGSSARQAGDTWARAGPGVNNQPASKELVTLLRGWGQLRANDSSWPMFDGKNASYPRFKREWKAYRETYHSIVNNDLAAKTLREKCVKGKAHKMVGHLEDLREIWDTLDTCYERPDKYMEEDLKSILEFRRYKMFDNGAIREFYSISRAAIKEARSIGRVDLLINDQTIPKIMGKMPFTNWKEWVIKRPEWI